MNYSLESFVEYCESGEVVEEAKKWTGFDRISYKGMRALQTNTIALNNQLSQQRKICKKEYDQAMEDGTLDQFFAKIEKKKTSNAKKNKR